MSLTVMAADAVLAVTQPTADGGPIEQVAMKILGLVWAFVGWVGLGAFLSGAAIWWYQKSTMQQSSVLAWLGGVLFFLGCGAMGASIVNWAMGIS